MLRRGRDGGSEGDEGARAAAAAGRRLHRPRTSQPVTLPPSGFFSFPAADWRLCLRPIFGFSARFSLLFGFPFWKTHLGAFCHLSRILIEKRRGAQCQMWVIICHVCIDLDDRKEGDCGVCMIGKWAIQSLVRSEKGAFDKIRLEIH